MHVNFLILYHFIEKSLVVISWCPTMSSELTVNHFSNFNGICNFTLVIWSQSARHIIMCTVCVWGGVGRVTKNMVAEGIFWYVPYVFPAACRVVHIAGIIFCEHKHGRTDTRHLEQQLLLNSILAHLTEFRNVPYWPMVTIGLVEAICA